MPAKHQTTLTGNPRLSALWVTHPDQAALECRLALIASSGDVLEAARQLSVAERTLWRWIRRHPEIRP